MVKPVESTTTQAHFFCDFCEQQMRGRNACYGCGKDVCAKCAKLIIYRDPFSGKDTGDYPPYICANCQPKLKPFADRAQLLRDAAEGQLSMMFSDFKHKCRAEV